MNDENLIRAQMHTDYIRDSEYAFVLVDSNRALNDKIVSEFAKRHNQYLMEGKLHQMSYILTKCDHIELDEHEGINTNEEFRHKLCADFKRKIVDELGSSEPIVFATAKKEYKEGYAIITSFIQTNITDMVTDNRKGHLCAQIRDLLDHLKQYADSDGDMIINPESPTDLAKKKEQCDHKMIEILSPVYEQLHNMLISIDNATEQFLTSDFSNLLSDIKHSSTLKATLRRYGAWGEYEKNNHIRRLYFNALAPQWESFFSDFNKTWDKVCVKNVELVIKQVFPEIIAKRTNIMAIFNNAVANQIKELNKKQKIIIDQDIYRDICELLSTLYEECADIHPFVFKWDTL